MNAWLIYHVCLIKEHSLRIKWYKIAVSDCREYLFFPIFNKSRHSNRLFTVIRQQTATEIMHRQQLMRCGVAVSSSNAFRIVLNPKSQSVSWSSRFRIETKPKPVHMIMNECCLLSVLPCTLLTTVQFRETSETWYRIESCIMQVTVATEFPVDRIEFNSIEISLNVLLSS